MMRRLFHLCRSRTVIAAFLTLNSCTSSSAFRLAVPATALRLHSSSSVGLEMTDKKQVLVPIADGSEEIETTCITDTLTRFGSQVTIASVKPDGDLLCTMSRGIKVQADTTIAKVVEDSTSWDLIVLPGGMPGAEHLRDCQPLQELLKKQKESGKLYGAICAAPAVALAAMGLIDANSEATCYPAPAFREKLSKVSEDPVVHAENLTTSQGPGTALKFALALGERLYGKEKSDEIAKQMLVD